MQGSLEEDFAALRKLRDDDESGALKKFLGDGEDPREWSCKSRRRVESCVTIADGRVTKLVLYKCTKLTVLPAALGGLALACETDWDCSLNGVCDATSGVCECDAPWAARRILCCLRAATRRGSAAAVLPLFPPPRPIF